MEVSGNKGEAVEVVVTRRQKEVHCLTVSQGPL